MRLMRLMRLIGWSAMRSSASRINASGLWPLSLARSSLNARQASFDPLKSLKSDKGKRRCIVVKCDSNQYPLKAPDVHRANATSGRAPAVAAACQNRKRVSARGLRHHRLPSTVICFSAVRPVITRFSIRRDRTVRATAAYSRGLVRGVCLTSERLPDSSCAE